MTVETLLSRLDRVRQVAPDRWSARCPGPAHAHGDRHPSLKIREMPDGRVLIDCRVCQDNAAIIAALGLTFSDLYPERPPTDTHIPPERRPFPAIDILRTLAFEASIVRAAAVELLDFGRLDDDSFARLVLAHNRIQSALTYAEGNHRG